MIRYILYLAAISLATGFYLATHDSLILMFLFFSPHISLGIPLAVAILLGIACRYEGELKRLWKWYGLTLLGMVLGLFCAGPLDKVMKSLPEWVESDFKIVVEVDTPGGVKTGEAGYQVLSNEFWVNGYRKGGKRLVGEGATIDLGDGKLLFFAVPSLERPRDYYRDVCLWAKDKQRRRHKRVELTGKYFPKFVGTKKTLSEMIRPQDIPDFFGPGFQLRRAWLEDVG